MLRWFFGLSLHSRIAIMLAPILAIGGFGLADLWTTRNQPAPAVEVKMLPLQLSERCVLSSKPCVLIREGFTLNLKQVATQTGLVRLEMVTPESRIRGIQMSLVNAKQEEHPIIVEPMKGETMWYGEFPESLISSNPKGVTLRIAVAQFGRVSYAEFPVEF